MPLRIIVMVKKPVAGYAKTRLIPALGEAGAAALAEHMLQQLVQQLLLLQQEKISQRPPLQIELCVSPDVMDTYWQVFRDKGLQVQQQVDGDLGARMQAAVERALAEGYPALLIGTDCPALDVHLLSQAVDALLQQQTVICPTFDGGYALLGLPSACDAVFNNMPWSTAEVYGLTVQRLADSGLVLHQLPMQHDIDEAADLAFLPAGWLN
ncbi:MAG: TIGR04282 family arsenosugar biosynthesis glycosyltransferase [Oceanospirillaceae bacterium]|nr:TIGR04282 family arsenosugar biosynthesis glycosyltransferase [Oceanospirillaceae bacterium]MCP5350693.1 TIGR04282 family arsenosugar biosynthesis glycosyltransferase [Oceanospirillaceae bacterium]